MFSRLVFVCVCGSPRDSCRKKQRERGDGIHCTFVLPSVCHGARWLGRLSLSFILVSCCCCVLNCVRCFYSTATIPAATAAAVFPLFIDEACVCLCLFSFYHLLRASVWARSSLILFSSSSLITKHKRNSLIYSHVQRERETERNANSYILSLFFLFVWTHTDTAVVRACVWYSFCWVSLGFWIPILNISVCVCVWLCVSTLSDERRPRITATRKKHLRWCRKA